MQILSQTWYQHLAMPRKIQKIARNTHSHEWQHAVMA